MVKKCGPVCPEQPCRPTPAMPAIEPIVSVKSVNGLNGDVVLPELIVKNRDDEETLRYNGSDQKVLSANFLGLKEAFVFRKEIPTKAKVIDLMVDALAGDIYFCKEDSRFYMSDGKGSYRSWVTNVGLIDWGNIGGNLDDQEDLRDALFLKTELKYIENLPEVGEVNIFYVVPRNVPQPGKKNIYDEYIWIPAIPGSREAGYELIGTTDFDPSEYAKTTYVDEKVRTEAGVRLAVDNQIKGLLQDESNRAQAAEAQVQLNIDNEAEARITADTDLSNSILAEKNDRIASVSAEKTRAEAKELALNNAINDENARAIEEEDKLKAGKLDIMPGDVHTGGNAYNLPYFFEQDVQADKVVVHAKTVTLDGKRTYGDYAMDVVAAKNGKAGLMSGADKAKLDTAVQPEVLAQAINAEKDARISEDNNLNSKITTEKNRAEAAELTLTTNLNSEISRATTKENSLATDIANEKNAREAAINKEVEDRNSAINTAINAEVIARNSAIENAVAIEKARAEGVEATLATKVELGNEATARQSADEALGSRITNELASEASARQSKDNELEGLIGTEKSERQSADTTLQNNIGAEATARENADNALGVRIDGVVADVATINGKIPAQATAENKLADKDFVNSSIQAAAANYVTYDAEGNSFPTKAALLSATTVYHGGQVYQPKKNDYAMVAKDEDHNNYQCRYIFVETSANAGVWNFQYTVNTTFTQAQQKAIDSGATVELIGQITTNKNDIAALGTRMTTAEGDIDLLEANKADVTALNEHIGKVNNPHAVTKTQVGLSEVDNTSDINKPISTAQQEALDKKADKTFVNEELAKKQNVIDDLATIRSGAALGATSIQPAKLAEELTAYRKSADQDVIDNAAKSRLSAIEAKEATWDAKQDKIDDLSTIRSNASAGKSASDTIATYGDVVTHNVAEFATAAQGAKADTAVQPAAISDMATKTWTNEQGFLKADDISGKADKTYVDAQDKAVKDWADGKFLTEHQDISGKVDKEINGTNGKAIIFNESDGGGAKFEHQDGTHSFVGVNDGGEDGLAAQLYAIDATESGHNLGAKLDIKVDGIYYTTGAASGSRPDVRDVVENEIVVKGDLVAKQDKLTPGTGIKIENNVISADVASTEFDGKTIIKGTDGKHQTAIGGWKEVNESLTPLFINTKGTGLPTYIGPSGTSMYEVGWDYDTTITSLVGSDTEATIKTKFTVLGSTFDGNVILYKQSTIPYIWQSNDLTIGGATYKIKVHDQYIGINNGGLTLVANDTSADLSDSIMNSLALSRGTVETYHPIDNKFLKLDAATMAVNASGELTCITSGGGVAKIKMNGEEKLPVEGVVDLGTVVTDVSGKLDKPVEPVSGQGVNVPYFFSVGYDANKATVTDYTIDLLDNTKAPQQFSLDINAATQQKAGLMSAADKIKLDNAGGSKLVNEIVANVAVGGVAVGDTFPVGTSLEDILRKILVIEKKLQAIKITTPPTKIVYTAGEVFDATGMVVKAEYNIGEEVDVTSGCTYSHEPLTVGTTTIQISYAEGGILKTTTQEVTVNAPTNYVYTGGAGSMFDFPTEDEFSLLTANPVTTLADKHLLSFVAKEGYEYGEECYATVAVKKPYKVTKMSADEEGSFSYDVTKVTTTGDYNMFFADGAVQDLTTAVPIYVTVVKE